MKPKLSARAQLARLIFGGTAGVAVLALGLQIAIIVMVLLDDPATPIKVHYVVSMLVLFCGAVLGLWRLKHSLPQALWLYTAAATLVVLSAIAPAAPSDANPPFVLYGLALGVFFLGMTLGVRHALLYAGLVSVLSVSISLMYTQRITTFGFPMTVFSFLMVLPSWLVDYLETSLRRSEEKFTIIVQESPDVIVVADPETGNVLHINPTVQHVLGYTEADLLGHSTLAFLAEETTAKLPGIYEELARTGAIAQTLDIRRADGVLCPMDVTANLIPWQDGQGVLLTLRDVTERQQREEELRLYREHLEDLVEARTTELAEVNTNLQVEVEIRRRAEATLRQYALDLEARNQELDTYAHTVAHDLKNPLTGVIGFSELLLSGYKELSMEKLAYYADIIAKKGHEMHAIIEELLLLASVREEDVVSAPLDMLNIVQRAQQRLDALIAQHQARIELVSPAEWPAALGHAPWIEAVWANYLSNALKYGGQPPVVKIGACPHENGCVCFWIRDNGRGMSVEDQRLLFEKFSRPEETRNLGHGLGLSIVRRIVEKLGGEVWVDSQVGQGSAFSFSLPAAAAGGVGDGVSKA